jgi:YD repeat-containing protein
MSQLTSLTDANSHTTAFHYDGYGRVDTVTYPSGAFPSTGETFTYDAAGRLSTKTDRRGVVTTFTYYDDGRLWKKTYDSQHRVLTKAGPDGSLVTYVQGTVGPTSITEKVTASQNRTTGITYTAAGKPWTITDPRSKVTTLGYNATGDLTSVTDPLTHWATAPHAQGATTSPPPSTTP